MRCKTTRTIDLIYWNTPDALRKRSRGLRTALDPALAKLMLTRPLLNSRKHILRVPRKQLSLCKTNLWESPLTFTRGKHAPRMSGWLQTAHRRRYKCRQRENGREAEDSYCRKAICSWLLMRWSPAMKNICPLMRNLSQPTLSLTLCFISSCSSFPLKTAHETKLLTMNRDGKLKAAPRGHTLADTSSYASWISRGTAFWSDSKRSTMRSQDDCKPSRH